MPRACSPCPFWNGIVGMVARGDADLGAGLAATAERATVLDFGVSVKPDLVSLFIARTGQGTLNPGVFFRYDFSFDSSVKNQLLTTQKEGACRLY